jgi:ubiquinone/menaquinone biosynthesis C-methylase UbiE
MRFIQASRVTIGILRNLLGIYVSPTRTIVNSYLLFSGLKKPEQTILKLLSAKAPFRMMLDIGVGAGRTTEYFSKIAKKYIGVDYSENMIKICSQRFKHLPNLSFDVKDARNLSPFNDNFFDLILFSHGGLDAVEHKDRMIILREIWRVADKEAFFCFSTSNLDAMFQFCQIKLTKNPKLLAKSLAKLILIRLFNKEMWMHVRGKKTVRHSMFVVGGHLWSLKTYCITLQAQINQLGDCGFYDIKAYDLQGNELSASINTTDIELYFLCKAKK